MIMKNKTNEHGIYKILNIINGKFYIGSAVNLHDRFMHHRKRLRKDYHNNQHLQRAYNKYGEDNFIFEVLEIVSDKNDLLLREQYWLDETDCYNRDIGYNLSKNATAPMLGMVFTEEHRKNISKGRTGIPMPEGHRERMSELHKGKEIPQDVRDKTSKSCKEAWTDEMKKKQSERMKERWKNDEDFRKSASNNYKKEYTVEDRKKISERKQGSKHHNARLTEEEVREIKTMLKNGINRKIIREKFDVSVKNLSKIATGKIWSHVIV